MVSIDTTYQHRLKRQIFKVLVHATRYTIARDCIMKKIKKLNLFIAVSLILHTVTIVALGVLTAAFLDFADFSHKYTQNLRNAITNQRKCMKHKDPICPDGKYYKGE